jgi:hypothetical protein
MSVRKLIGKFVKWCFLVIFAVSVTAAIMNPLIEWFLELLQTNDFILAYRRWIAVGLGVLSVGLFIGVIQVTRNLKLVLRKWAPAFAKRWFLYQVGDPHPHHKFLAFVEYDEQGHGVWTSVYGDTEAPYRLAKLNAQRRAAGTRISPHSEDSQACPQDTSATQRQSVQDVRPNKNRLG